MRTLNGEASKTPKCIDACYAMPECLTCGKRKVPRGRLVPDAMATSRCTALCVGYTEDPQAGHLWPDERDSPGLAL
jgi:hypothetical protein